MTDIYVDANGSDDATGSEDKPYTTIQAAINVASSGDTIIIAAGEYSGNVEIPAQLTNLTILAANHGIDGDDTTRGDESSVTGTFLIRADNVTIDGLEFANDVDKTIVSVRGDNTSITNSVFDGGADDSTGASRPIVVGGNVTGLNISDNLIENYTSAIYVNPGVEGSISGNLIRNSGYGMSVDTDGVQITGNTLENLDGAYIAIGVEGTDYDLRNFVSNNEFDDSRARPISIYKYSNDDTQTIHGTDVAENLWARQEYVKSGENTFIFYGEGGSDLIDSGFAADTIYGGSGADTISGKADWLSGDLIPDFEKSDVIMVTDADSTASVEYDAKTGMLAIDANGDDSIDATMTLKSGLNGTFSIDDDGTITFKAAPTGGGGDDGDIGGGTTGGEEDDKLTGTDNADTMSGGGGNDEIEGGGGNDTLFSGEGNDTVDGGDGDDMVFGGVGDDVVTGGAGNDQAYGGTGNDDIDGGDGDDFLGGGEGNDTIIGGAGNDVLFGGRPGLGADANDAFYAGDGDDQGFAGDGDDIATGGNGADEIGGGSGNDTVGGGNGNDLLYGGAGDDMLYGGADADTVYGGSGNDQIYFGDNDGAADIYASVADNGTDVVFGFENGTDHLDVRANGFTSFAELTISEDGEGNATIDLGGGNVLTLNGVAASELDASDFLF
ncbi:DUF1565 domain-containing protein [Afifella sp. JA880]|uniref:DUF1565 domain-containing protein n=1 Tax=Afifella sp. JA880 TaxID=2975280 RepID=UPI0021BA5082|nr:DUF1565 domain-containing protein [Afifella sp. JA880]MCT8266400.1 DUF1565 domain-containing protein [Afifella sp. JA880]